MSQLQEKLNSSNLESVGTVQDNPSENATPAVSNPVYLNVYGLTEVNEKLRPQNIGIYHVGVQAHGTEWSYGFHRFHISGIYSMYQPRDLKSLSKNEKMFYFVESINIGNTHSSLDRIASYLSDLGRTDWTGLKYNMIYKNSADFALKLCLYLCGKEIPRWINCFGIINQRFSSILTQIPEDFRTPLALKEIIQQKVDFAQQVKQQKLSSSRDSNMIAKSKESLKTNRSRIEANKTNNSKSNIDSDSLEDFTDSKILAAPSMDDFKNEVEKSKKEK